MADRDPGPFAADPAAYANDVHAWTRAQATLLRARRFEALDLDNIIEEIESLGNEQQHAVESYMAVLIEHLLKLAVSGDSDPRRGWRISVANARNGIERRLGASPSLRRKLPGIFLKEYAPARRLASLGLREAEETLVPAEPPFTLAEALDPEWFPPGR